MVNGSVTSVVSVFLDTPRLELTRYVGYKLPTLEWAKTRIEFFREWTLKSLRNQSFRDFRVFLLCSKHSKELVESYEWDDVEVCYDDGRSRYEAMDTDYITVTRLDSDDLFHKATMEIIHDRLVLSDGIERLFMSDYYRWLRLHECMIHITNPLTIDMWSPCYTIIFPKAEYKDWAVMHDNWFVYVMDTFKKRGHPLPPDLVCMIRLEESTHHAVHEQDPFDKHRLAMEINSARGFGRKIMWSPEEHMGVLKDFGISREQYLGGRV